MPAQLFSLGRVVMTTNLQHKLTETLSQGWDQELKAMMDRHVSGDWGDLGEFNRQQNDRALKKGGRIFSAYYASDGTNVWVITETDRSYTTVLLPEDY